MFPRLRGAWGPMRRVAFAVVPAAFGALLLLSGDRPGTGTSRLEVTQGTVPELLAGDPVPQTTVLTPSLSASEQPTTTTSTPTGAAVAATGGTAIAPDPPTGTGPVSTGAVATTTPATPATTSGASSRDGPAATAESTSAPLASSGETTNRATTTTTSPPPQPPQEEVRVTTTTTVAARSGPVRTPGVESEVVPLTNRDRNAAGLGALSRHSCLDAVASRYAEQLARSGTLAHNPGAGAAVTDCRPGAAWGDNVGTAGPCSASLLEEKWMASPTHRRNILTPGFQHIGVGAWTDEAGACWVQVLFSS